MSHEVMQIVETDIKKIHPQDWMERRHEMEQIFSVLSRDELLEIVASFKLEIDHLLELHTKSAAIANDFDGMLRKSLRQNDEFVSNNRALMDAIKHMPSTAARHATKARWSRLDSVKDLAFERRKQFAHLKRSPAIDRFLPEILEACRAAGEPLSGGDPKATVERWFRKAGIK